ncbi:MAG: alpha-2-macroglobulin family protein [Saprospiraceae bacterium]
MRKQLVYALLATVAAAGLFMLVRNQKIVKNEAYFEAVSKYIYAFTSGSISRDDVVRVRFVNAAVSQEQVGKEVPAKVFSTDPKIEGKAVWEDDRTIKFTPAQALKPGKHYTAHVAVKRIYADAPSLARNFDFDFSVRELAFDVVKDGLSADPNDIRHQRVTGRVRVNESCLPDKIEKMLTARQGNKALLVSWQHSEDGRLHQWTVAGVERTNVASSVRLAWSGSPIGVEKNMAEEQAVPPFGEFLVLSAKAVQVEEQYVLLNFSDPISSAQDLSGLVRIDNYNGKLRYVTDGNFVRVYPAERITGMKNIQVDGSIRSAAGQSLNAAGEWKLIFEDLKPGVRLVGRGAIIPQQAGGGIIFPFEAVGLTAVDVEVFKIFNSNILQFMQVNEIEGEQELERVGKIVLQKKFDLAAINPEASSTVWQRYALDLKDMIQKDPGAIYQVRLAFKMDYTSCSTASIAADEGDDNEDGMVNSIMGGYRGIYWKESDSEYWWQEGDDYNWDNREVPCAKEYYNYEHFSKRNVFVSDLGLTAKRGRDGSLFLAVTDLHTAQPVSGIDIELLSFQLQPIVKTRTEGDGTVMVEGLRETPFLAVATAQGRRGYLRMADGNALSLSRFDVAGVESQKGLKGYIYGERGVWRPGDSLYLNFVLEDKTGRLPQGHPVVFELRDPAGALQYRTVQTAGVNGVYPFYCATRAEAKTGNWQAHVMVGGATFSRPLKIETVKPNRLKLDLNFGPRAFLTAKDFDVNGEGQGINGALKVKWLHGATAQNLKSTVEMQVRAVATEFTGYKGYSFDDPSRYFYSEPEVLFDANLDQNGQANVPLKIGQVSAAPGKLIANFKVRAFEAGGDFSTDNFALDVLPYDRFVGVFIPTDKWGSKVLDRNGKSKVNFAVLNNLGKPVANHKVTVALYRVDWRWWWDDDARSGIGQFNSSELNDAVDHAVLTTDARGQASWLVKPTGWGRYLVRIADTEEGHTAGDFFWAGHPEQLDDIKSRNAAAMLPFTAEKEKYNVGEEVVLKVPASENGRILLTLETGTRVARHLWFDAVAGDNFLKFKAEKDMAPTVYAHVSLIQPHAQTKNDLPIRMYGVTPVNIENSSTRLEAQIDMPDQLKPDEFFNISLREKGGKACVYTLDVVDEGLLDLTRFKTPNPWESFYAREAHGVKTWDIYDYVLGAYGAELSRILAIGGDGINQKAKNANQVNRFKPCVIHLGPFKLEKGQTAKHRLKIENYVGSVRVMAVLSAPAAGGEGAYGNAEKTCPVRKPLMIMPTLPRVLGPGETLRLPVEVFAMEKSVNSATVNVRESSGLVKISGSSNTLTFSEPGQKLTYFDLKVGEKTGVAKFSISATGGGETATSEIEIEVRNPHPLITRVLDGSVEPGQTWAQPAKVTDFSDLEAAVLEVSNIPPINLSKQLDYIIQYPHGCIEQTTSAAFPQLYVDLIAPLSTKQQQEIQKNVMAAIAKLQNFQMASGAFSYWTGGNEVADWAGTYAGHFLMEAKARGFAVPQNMLDKWVDYQVKSSRTWEPGVDNDPHGWWHHDNEMSQAYRLYTLAIAGKADLAGMNRLREKRAKYESSASLLAAAYATAGKNEAARDLLNDANAKKFAYTWWGYTYGSDLRDLALKLETLSAVGDNKRGLEVALQVASQVGDAARWYSTQEIGTCLRALCKYTKKATFGDKSDFIIKAGGREIPVNSTTPYYLYPLGEELSGGVSVKNTSKQKLFTRIVLRGRPVSGDEPAESSNISLGVRYTDLKGSAIEPAKLKQGTDFLAEVTVTRTGTLRFDFNELALTQIFASGWEILNTRMSEVGGSSSDPMDYQDVRDDRVFTYFDLPFNWTNNKDAKQSRTYRIQLNAAYAGRYYLPAVACEAMYDNRIRAVQPGKWVEVVN